MRELLPDLERLLAGSTPVGRGVVISVWGSAPQPTGSVMIATADGRMEGAVCGGCIEGAVLEEIQAAISRGTPKLLTFGVSEQKAWSAGLACGGKIEVLVEPAVRPELISLLAQRIGMVLVTVLGGLGGAVLVTDDGREPRILPAFQGDPIAQTGTTEELAPFLPAIVRMAEHALGTEISSKTEVTMEIPASRSEPNCLRTSVVSRFQTSGDPPKASAANSGLFAAFCPAVVA